MTRLRYVIGLVLTSTLLAGCGLVGGGSDEAELVGYFKDVGDLVPRATVQVNDVEIGEVTGIELVLQDGEMLAKVTMSVGADKGIPADNLAALVRQTSLLGEQFIELLPDSDATGKVVGEVDVTIPVERTEKRVSVETVLEDLSGLLAGGSLEDLNRFTHAQALILEGRGDKFNEELKELERFTSILAGRRQDIASAIDHLADASSTLAGNTATIDSFLDSLDEANALLADQGDELVNVFSALRRFGQVNAQFLAKHEDAIDRQFKALEPVLDVLSETSDELRVDLAQLNTFFELFPKSFGGGPGGDQFGDYIQSDAILCETLSACHTKGERGDVPGEGH